MKTLLRRYRQFSALHSAMQKRFIDVELPPFPKKRLIGNLSGEIVEKRRRKLETYLQVVATYPDIDDVLGFTTFLGSELSQRGRKKSELGRLDPELEELYKETDKEREHRMLFYSLPTHFLRSCC